VRGVLWDDGRVEVLSFSGFTCLPSSDETPLGWLSAQDVFDHQPRLQTPPSLCSRSIGH